MNEKKLGLFLGLAVVCGIFAGCNESKDYTFEEALAMTQSKNEVVTDFILNNSAFKGNFDATLGVKAESDELAVKVKGNFEKAQDDQTSADIHFDVDGEVAGTKVPVKGDISAIATSDASYIKLGTFDFKSSDESVAGLVNAFINPLKDQWFKLDLNEIYAQAGMNDFASASKAYMEKYLASIKEMMDDGMATRLYKSTWHEPYAGVFEQYKGKNAWQFTLNDEEYQTFLSKIVDLTAEYYRNLGETLGEEGVEELNEALEGLKNMKFKDFVGNLVINGEDVIVVFDSFSVEVNGITMNVSTHYGVDGMYLSIGVQGETEIYEGAEKSVEKIDLKDVIVLDAQKKKGDTYDFTLKINDGEDVNFTLKGTVSLSIDSDKLSVKITFPYEGEENEKIDVDCSFSLEKVKNVSIKIPEETQDLMELLGGFMGGMMGASMDDGDYSSYEMMEGNEVSETWETETLPSGEAE